MRSVQSPSLSDEYSETDGARRAQDGGGDSFDDRFRTAIEDSTYDSRLRRPRSGSPQRASVLESNRFANKRPSILKRTGRFLVAVLIGIGATLSWQSYGDEAQKMVATWAPSLAWLLPVSAPNSTTAAASSPDLAQQLKPIAFDIAAVRHQVEQLAVNQGQIAANEGHLAQSVAALQAIDRDVSQKISSVVQPRPVHLQPRKPAQRPAPPSNEPARQ